MSRGFGFIAPGSYTQVDRYSQYASESLENVVRVSGASQERVKHDFKKYAPEASAAYFVDLSSEDEDEEY